MRPYLSIIKDSFRAAMASRVLYVLLVVITILLLLLAPIWIKEDLAWEIKFSEHIRNPDSLAKRLGKDGPVEQDKLVHHVFKMLPEKLQGDLVRFFDKDKKKELEAKPGQDDPFGNDGQFARQMMIVESIKELNRIIKDEQVYDAEVFKDQSMSPEAEGFIERGVDKLSDDQRRRLNRLLIERSIGYSVIRSGPPSSLTISYAIWSTFFQFNVSHPEMHKVISSWLPYILDKFVLSIGLLIAVLITASLIPEMLQSSSLSLLLSKPITRWGLLLSKFTGGCAFVAILATYLFTGIWFLLGIRLGYWDKAILLSIPVYVFVFAIYFSVSTLVGVIYRNTIVSIVLTFIFWGICFGIGATFRSFDSRTKASSIVDVIESKGAVFQVDAMSFPYQFDQAKNEWGLAMADDQSKVFSQIFYVATFFQRAESMTDLPPPVGPVFDPTSDVVVLGQADFQRPQTMDRRKLMTSNEAKKWAPINAGYLPRSTVELFSTNTLGLIAVTGTGEFLLLSEDPIAAAEKATEKETPAAESKTDETPDGEPDSEDKPESKDNPETNEEPTPENSPSKKSASAKPNIRMASSPQFQSSFESDDEAAAILNLELFKRIGPNRRVDVIDANHVDLNPLNNEIAIYQNGVVSLFKFVDGQYEFATEMTPDLQVDASMSAWIVYRGNTILIALGNGELVTIARDTFEERNTYSPETRSAIRSVDGSFDGRWIAVTYRNGNMWMLDMENPDSVNKAPIRGQGDISSGSFNADGNVWVASNIDQITLYNPTDWSVVKSIKPNGYFLTNAYRYVVNPVYLAFPKPGEFYKLVSHLSDNAAVKYDRNLDLTKQAEPARPWDPFRSGLIFLAFTLGIACFIFQRQEY